MRSTDSFAPVEMPPTTSNIQIQYSPVTNIISDKPSPAPHILSTLDQTTPTHTIPTPSKKSRLIYTTVLHPISPSHQSPSPQQTILKHTVLFLPFANNSLYQNAQSYSNHSQPPASTNQHRHMHMHMHISRPPFPSLPGPSPSAPPQALQLHLCNSWDVPRRLTTADCGICTQAGTQGREGGREGGRAASGNGCAVLCVVC